MKLLDALNNLEAGEHLTRRNWNGTRLMQFGGVLFVRFFPDAAPQAAILHMEDLTATDWLICTAEEKEK